jgi:hypothetical protein
MTVDQKQNGPMKELWQGIGIAVGIYLLGLLMMFTTANMLIIYLGVAPIVLIVLTVISFSKGKKQLGQGLLIGMGLDILLFAACFGIFMTNLGG